MSLNENIKSIYRMRFGNKMHEDFFESSGFSNFGYWEEGTLTAKEASTNLVDHLLAYIPEKSGTVLDVACGQGGTTRRLMDFYAPSEITAINIQKSQLVAASRNAPGCNFILMDASELQFPSDSFDNILCVEAACHFNTRERFLERAYEVLKPGGRLLMTDLQYRRYDHLPSFLKGPELVPAANYFHDLGEYEALCSKVGFEDVEIKEITDETWRTFRREWLKFRLQKRYGRTFLRVLIQNLVWTYAIKSYLLVVAVKPDNGNL